MYSRTVGKDGSHITFSLTIVSLLTQYVCFPSKVTNKGAFVHFELFDSFSVVSGVGSVLPVFRTSWVAVSGLWTICAAEDVSRTISAIETVSRMVVRVHMS